MTNRTNTIATLNDRFRAEFAVPSLGPRSIPGLVVCTTGITTLPQQTQICIWTKVANFDSFNDSLGERESGSFDIEGLEIVWKIDCYADASCTTRAEDRADLAHCFRVLTIMLTTE